MLIRLVTLSLFLIMPALAWSQTSNAVNTDTSGYASIRQLMVLSNARTSSTKTLESMRAPLRQMVPQVPEKVFNELFDELIAMCDDGVLTELTVPIYARHFSKSEIRELIAFYQTPIGKKLSAESPKINQEASLAGQEFGRTWAMKFVEKLKARGYEAR